MLGPGMSKVVVVGGCGGYYLCFRYYRSLNGYLLAAKKKPLT